MKATFRRLMLGLASSLLFVLNAPASAISIYVIDNQGAGHPNVTSAVNDLVALGHTVTQGGTLASYAGYGQVWDLNYAQNLTAGDITAMGAYLASGGRTYLTGEWSAFNGFRNDSLVNFVSGVGGGTMTLTNGDFVGLQSFTSQAIAVGLNSSPNGFVSVSYNNANTVAGLSQGFLATTGGSLLGWDFGDIMGAPASRMLIGLDIEIFDNGRSWTENMVTYLGAPAANVPEPSSFALLAFGLAGLGFSRRKKA